LPTPNDPSPAELDKQWKQGPGRLHVQSADGLFIRKRRGWAVSPLTDEEMARLQALYGLGFELWTRGFRDDNRDPLNQFVDLVGQHLEGKILELIHIGEIAGGTIFIDASCPDIQIVSVTAARALEAAQDPDTFRSFCLPAVPEGETPEETVSRETEEADLIWVLAFIDPDKIFDKLKDRFKSIVDQFGTGGIGHSSQSNPPELGPFPSDWGNPDVGTGGSDWLDTDLGAAIQICLDPPPLIYFNGSGSLFTAFSGGFLSASPVFELGDETFADKIYKFAATQMAGRFARWQFDGCKLLFDGAAMTMLHVEHPFAFTIGEGDIPYEVPNIEVGETGARDYWPDPDRQTLDLAIKLNNSMVSDGEMNIVEWNMSEHTFGRWGNPSTRNAAWKGRVRKLHFTLEPILNPWQAVQGILNQHNGYRVHLRCFQVYEGGNPRFLPYHFLATSTPAASAEGWGTINNYGSAGLEWFGDPHGSARHTFLIPFGQSTNVIHLTFKYLSDTDQTIRFWLSDNSATEDAGNGFESWSSGTNFSATGGWAGGVTGAWRDGTLTLNLDTTIDDRQMFMVSQHYGGSNFLLREITITL
jgi:hypothetical protein